MAKRGGRVGIFCALPEEIAALRRAMTNLRSRRRAGTRFLIGRLDGRSVVLAEGGVGKVNAAIVATLMIEAFRCRALVMSGVAGGLDPKLAIGDIVIGAALAQHDFGIRERGGWRYFRAGSNPLLAKPGALGFELDDELRRRLRKMLRGFRLPTMPAVVTGAARRPRIRFGRIVTGDQFINDPKERRRLRRDFKAQAVEMEGAAIAQVAAQYGLPCLVVRALSDRAGDASIKEIFAFLKIAGENAAATVRRLLPAL